LSDRSSRPTKTPSRHRWLFVEVDDDEVVGLDTGVEHLLVLVVGQPAAASTFFWSEAHVERLLDESHVATVDLT
jgi:hypothetical protein